MFVTNNSNSCNDIIIVCIGNNEMEIAIIKDFLRESRIDAVVKVSSINTVEPLIKDPPRKGQPLYKGYFQYPQKCTCICKCNTFQFPKRGQPPYKGQYG